MACSSVNLLICCLRLGRPQYTRVVCGGATWRFTLGWYLRMRCWGRYMDLSGSNRWLEKTAYWGALSFVLLIKHYSEDQVRIWWARHVARMGKKWNAHSVLVLKPAVNRRLGRPRHRWENNIKMYLSDNGRAWAGFSELRTEISGGLLWTL